MSESNASVKQRLSGELKSYAAISVYLLICFSVVLFYQASLIPGKNAGLLPHGFALGKALVVGKFILIGEALKVGSRLYSNRLANRIFWKTIALLALLVVLTLVEEVIVGMVHGQSIVEAFAEILGKPWTHWLAPVLLMLLILIPLTTTCELDKALGKGKLKQVLLASDPEQSTTGN